MRPHTRAQRSTPERVTTVTLRRNLEGTCMKQFAVIAALAAASASASAQSSVTVFGVIDANVGSVNNGAGSVKSVGNSGNETSRLGFRGIEDLGGGLHAGFWLEGQIFNDTGLGGAPGSANQGMSWQRRSTISLISDTLGEVRLGRDTTPNYTSRQDFDPFTLNGVGSEQNMMILNQPIEGTPQVNATPLGSGSATFPRASNTVEYFLPGNLGGVYGQAMVAAGEGSVNGKYSAGRLGYKTGQLNVSLEAGKASLGPNGLKEINAGASYDFGVVKLMGQYGKYTLDRAAAIGSTVQKNLLIGATAPVGPGTVKVSYNRVQISGADTGVSGLGEGKAHMIAAGYVYDLSKRTALYTSYSRISNDPRTQFTVGGQQNGPSVHGATGRTSSGYEIGIRHRF
jgi:predicted porin